MARGTFTNDRKGDRGVGAREGALSRLGFAAFAMVAGQITCNARGGLHCCTSTQHQHKACSGSICTAPAASPNPL